MNEQMGMETVAHLLMYTENLAGKQHTTKVMEQKRSRAEKQKKCGVKEKAFRMHIWLDKIDFQNKIKWQKQYVAYC